MAIRRIVPIISSANLEGSKKFYVDFIGLELVMDLGWILTFASESNPTAQISVKNSEPSDADNKDVFLSIETSDVDELYKKALDGKMEVVYPLKVEDWGVKRFFVKDPNGVTVNLLTHLNDR